MIHIYMYIYIYIKLIIILCIYVRIIDICKNISESLEGLYSLLGTFNLLGRLHHIWNKFSKL